MSETFPLSKEKRIKGTRRIAREKVLQIITAMEVCGGSEDTHFDHIFHRRFKFDEDKQKSDRLLKPDEIVEMESDIPIKWSSEDIAFARELIRKTMAGKENFDEMIRSSVDNWELDRIANIDRILMHMALAELLNFQEIPPKVSVNEAIDIAKKYSTDKSGIFINGILDSLLIKLKKTGKIVKTGRGLKEK